jgi:hypothetical protein
MAVTREFVPVANPDPGDSPGFYVVTGTDKAETYTTQQDDGYVYMKGGSDTVYIEGLRQVGGENDISVYGGDGDDRLLDRMIGISGKYLSGNGGNDYIEVAVGDESSAARGGAGNDVLKALGDGAYISLYGDAGDDKLYASPDALTTLNGGLGRDRLHCDTNEDTLVFFTHHSGTGATRDVVYRFDEDDDRIDLSGMDANRRVDGNQEFTWLGKVDGPSEVVVDTVGYYQSGHDLIVAGNSGVRFEVGLHGLEGHTLHGDEFFL